MFGLRKQNRDPGPAGAKGASSARVAAEGEGPVVAPGHDAGAANATEPPAAGDGAALEGLAPEGSAEGGSLPDEERAERLRQLTELVDMVRPIIQQDGGDLMLVSADVEAGTVELQLQGACSSCAISATTLQAGVERIIKDRLPWVREVTGGVDEEIDWYESAAMGRGAYVPKW
jgi:Fe-S cluster biogenesis protein NfuA